LKTKIVIEKLHSFKEWSWSIDVILD